MLLYSDLTYAINGAAFHVYNKLGHGFLEAVYQEALEIEFQRRNIPYEREKELKIHGKIIIELKAVSALDDAHRSQVYNYLHATGFKLGLLYNFGCSDELEKERIVV